MKKSVRSVIRSALSLLAAVVVAGAVLPTQVNASQTEKVKEALQVMRAEAAKLGEPKVDGTKLLFGSTRINGDYTIVDGLKTRFGCTATFFVVKGTDFLRVSTNVLNDGNRAVGTVLNVSGPAYAANSKGEAYYGIVDILGKKYDAGYELIKNSAGETVGLIYVGFSIP